jgi:hypothetical protein
MASQDILARFYFWSLKTQPSWLGVVNLEFTDTGWMNAPY